MSVIVKNASDGKIRVMCKGADSIVLARLKDQNSKMVHKTINYLENYSREGLRTLLIAEKEISERDYQEWNAQYQ